MPNQRISRTALTNAHATGIGRQGLPPRRRIQRGADIVNSPAAPRRRYRGCRSRFCRMARVYSAGVSLNFTVIGVVMASIGRRLRRAQNDPETEEGAALGGDVLLALRRPAVERPVVPAAAPDPAERGGVLGGPPGLVRAPLGDVAVHVVEAPRVRPLLRDDLRRL